MAAGGGDSESGLAWWEAQFFPRAHGYAGEEGAAAGVAFRGEFFPALLRVCEAQALLPELSLDELRVLVRFCLGDAARKDDAVSKQDFLWFLARFGPLEQSIQKLVANFCVNREMAPWFHGSMGRGAAERVLTAPELDDGAFLVRFSESQPTKFTLSYLKVHATSGRREVKNCLVENMGRSGGYALLEGSRSRQQRTYTSLQTFVQHNSSRLKYGVPSELARACNYELADLRAMCDHQSDAYTAFSSETVVDAQEAQTNGAGYSASMLFTRSPVLRAQSEYQQYGFQLPPPESGESSKCCADSYSGFSLDALSAIPSDQNDYPSSGASSKRDIHQRAPADQEADYGNFAAFAQQTTSSKTSFYATGSSTFAPSVPDVYANFDAFAASGNLADESRELAARQAQFVSLSRSPTRIQSNAWENGNQHEGDNVYGSFASANVTSLPTPVLPVTIKALPLSSMSADSSSDYGSFAAMADSEKFDQFSATSSGSTLPEWDPALGPPPSPPRPILPRPSPSAAPPLDDVYGSFLSLTIADHRVSPRDSDNMFASSASLPNLSTSDENLLPLNDSAGVAATKSESANAIPDISASTPSLPLPHPQRGSALEELNAGMTFYKQKQLDEAILRFIIARETARETNDKVVEARALGNLGTVYLDRQSPRQAVECYEKCLEITRSIDDTKRERTILNNLVLAFVACDEFAEALAYCQVQLEVTSNDINRRKILSRMSLLRERMARAAAKREADASAAFA